MSEVHVEKMHGFKLYFGAPRANLFVVSFGEGMASVPIYFAFKSKLFF
jgi:hypothetical protein